MKSFSGVSRRRRAISASRLMGGIALRLRFRPHAHAFQKQAARLLGESRGTDLKQCGKRYAPTHRIGYDQGFPGISLIRARSASPIAGKLYGAG